MFLRLLRRAGIAQLVERNLAKVEVASSSLVSRSRFPGKRPRAVFLFWSVRHTAEGKPPRIPTSGPYPWRKMRLPNFNGGVAEWSCSGLQSRVRRFDSDPRLHIIKDLQKRTFAKPRELSHRPLQRPETLLRSTRGRELCSLPPQSNY